MKIIISKIFLLFLIVFCSATAIAQRSLQSDGVTPITGSNINNRGISNQRLGDTSFKKRDEHSDSLTIYFKYYNQLKIQSLDTTINDFYNRFSLPFYYNHLGNLGTAARSFYFNPILKAGFDAGFHQFDSYNFNLENTKFYNTTKPYTEFAYLLGSNAEQTISVLHTQNKKDNLNYSIEYRFINSPGIFKNQNASVNNTRLTLNYKSPNKRYHLAAIFIANKNASSENGGTVNYKQLDSLALNNPFELPVRLGLGGIVRRNLFSTTVNTGNIYKQNNLVLKQQYDFGQKDSIVTDSTTIKLFYPKIRLQHLFSVKNSDYLFIDANADSTNYSNYFNYTINKNSFGTIDTITFRDNWKIFENELSIISFPDKKNASQYIKASISLQNLVGTFKDISSNSLYNVIIAGEYKNSTKNKIWDIEATAELFVNGFNSGDYSALISLQKLLSKNVGTLQLGFQNVNRSPSFIYNAASSFRVTNRINFSKENSTKIWANYNNDRLNLSLIGEYYLMSNYLYFDNFFTAKQEGTLFNVVHVGLEKKFKLSKHWNFYTELHLQQTTNNAPVNLPKLFTRNRIAFEGNFYTNLFLSTGLEVRYNSNFSPAGYSPFNGQFFYQDNFSVTNKPDINLFFNFRIKTFKGFFRAENLNTLIPPNGYKQYNYSVEQYPMQSVWMRFGVWWNFVN